MLDRLGLVIHPEKSVFIPHQKIVFFGFVIDSARMIVMLTEDKIHKLKDLLTFTIHRIRDIARLIGHLVSSLPAVKYGTLYYRYLEMNKINALKYVKGNFEAIMAISEKGVSEMQSWLSNLDGSFNTIRHPPVDVTLHSDASLEDWGAVMNDISTGGRWSVIEAHSHINCLELLAVLFALKCFYISLSGKHVKLMIDNTTAVAVINNMEHAIVLNVIPLQYKFGSLKFHIT